MSSPFSRTLPSKCSTRSPGGGAEELRAVPIRGAPRGTSRRPALHLIDRGHVAMRVTIPFGDVATLIVEVRSHFAEMALFGAITETTATRENMSRPCWKCPLGAARRQSASPETAAAVATNRDRGTVDAYQAGVKIGDSVPHRPVHRDSARQASGVVRLHDPALSFEEVNEAAELYQLDCRWQSAHTSV